MEGRDVIASAQTGTGKTAAYALPALHRLQQQEGKHWPRVLVLSPTRELAIQVDENFQFYGKFMDLRTALLYGGVGYGKQNQDLQNRPDVVVATPGRLLDYLNRGSLRLGKLEILVLDEVDRMFDHGVHRGCHDHRQQNAEIPSNPHVLGHHSGCSKAPFPVGSSETSRCRH